MQSANSVYRRLDVEKRTLGRTGLNVSVLGYGAMAILGADEVRNW